MSITDSIKRTATYRSPQRIDSRFEDYRVLAPDTHSNILGRHDGVVYDTLVVRADGGTIEGEPLLYIERVTVPSWFEAQVESFRVNVTDYSDDRELARAIRQKRTSTYKSVEGSL